jgi:2-polyprenyl-3-methyl-5-hydroxy-6-metoxy-1,4-benzoquinol methylase
MDPKYGERYRDLFEKHWWWRARSRLIVDELRRIRPQQGWKTILDIGCGDGLFFPELSRFGDVEGVEPFEALVNPGNPYRNRIAICPFDENYQPGKQYSLILMLDVLEHIEHAVAALRHAVSLLEPDGTLILTLPAFMALWTNHDVMNQHFIRYTKTTFREVARQAGFQIREQRYLYHWTCPVKMGIHWTEQLFRRAPKPAEIPMKPVNELMYLVSRLEQMTVTRLSMPFGSSLLIVGQKSEGQKSEG